MARNLKGIVLGTFMVVLTLLLTFGDSKASGLVLRNRLIVGLMFLLPGTVALVFRAPTLRFCLWMAELTRLSDDKSQSLGAQQVADFGRWVGLTGIAIMLASITDYLR